MGFFANPFKRSYHQNQSSLDNLIQQYVLMGFEKTHIIKAWQNCQGNPNQFHEELILVSQQENAKVMNEFDLMSSQIKLQKNLNIKEDDDIKRAIQLSLQDDQLETLEDLKNIIRKDKTINPGLKNLGNTCYMNVMLQAIYNVKAFRNLLFNMKIDQNTEDLGQLMILRLQELFALMETGNRQYVSPQAFFEAMAKFKPSTMLVKGVQNDYYELWVSFFDAIESGLSNVLNIVEPQKGSNQQIQINYQHLNQTQQEQKNEEVKTHPIMELLKKMFYGKSEEALTYSEKDNEITRFTETTFGVVNLDSKDKELYKAFKNCQSLQIDEYLSDNGFKSKAKIEIKILEPPKVLSFYINRVNYDQKQKKLIKNNGFFSIPDRININWFYKDPNETQKYNKTIQDKVDNLNKEENECYEQMKQNENMNECDQSELFDSMIKLMKRNEQALEKQISINDFVMFDNGSGITSDMINPTSLIAQLEKYKTLFNKRQILLNDKLKQIQSEKKQLLDDKQNIYVLTAVIIHDGVAESGHYTCFILDKCSNKWLKCNDRTVSQVDYDAVIKAASGKQGQYMNASGLVYEEENWMKTNQEEKVALPEYLTQYVEAYNKQTLRQIDEQLILNSTGRVQMRMSQISQRLTNKLSQTISKDDFNSIIECFTDQDLFMITQNTTIQQYHAFKLALQIEMQEVMSQLHFPELKDQYCQTFIKTCLQKLGFKKPQNDLEKDYQQIISIYPLIIEILHEFKQISQININLQNFESITSSYRILYNKLQQVYFSNKSQSQIFKLLKQLQFILESIHLKGCFFVDLLIQQQSLQVVDLIKFILNSVENTVEVTEIIKKQICSNFKESLEKIKTSTLKKNDQFIKQLQDKITQLEKLDIKPKDQVLVQDNIQKKQFTELDIKTLKNNYLELSSKQIKQWMDFHRQIVRSNKLLSQNERIEKEEIYYFEYL